MAEGELGSLRPSYDEGSHKTYVDYLKAALADPENRNIALAGQFGTGKSSILAGLTSALKEQAGFKVTQLTLSTLNAEAAKAAAETQEGAGDGSHAVTRALEKEIVKQLLYRELPAKMPGSRFRRMQDTPPKAAAGWGALAVLLVGLVTFGLALPQHLLTAAGVALLAGAGTFWAARRRGAGVSLKQLGAGGAVAHLEDSRSYFDDYLGDIIYYFQVSKVQVVIFEDIDRFENLSIFESLRELNLLLNETQQLAKSQPIRFIYATRDSIFKHAAPGAPSKAGGPESVASSRTKFFDLVIPVVPFATRRTSREHLKRALGVELDQKLVDLVSGEITDMRLIKNIANEFHVFRPWILPAHGSAPRAEQSQATASKPALTQDGLFAMIVYKNLYPVEFEKITTGESELDLVHAQFREIVNSTAARLEEQAQHAALHPTLAQATKRMKDAAKLLGATSAQISGSAQFTADQWGTYDFWRAVAANAQPIHLLGAPSGRPLLQVSELLEGSDSWSEETIESMEHEGALEHIKKCHDDRSSIIGAGMRELQSTQIDLVNTKGKPVEFGAEIKKIVTTSTLVRSMLKYGYIDRNYALYIAGHDTHSVTFSARNFVLTSIDPNRPDARFEFDDPATDIPGVFLEAGEAFLTDRRAFNVQILDYLMTNSRPERITLAELIQDGTDQDREFMNVYLTHGKYQAEFVQLVAAQWSNIYTYLIPGDRDPNPELVDAALNGYLPTTEYETSEAVRAWIDENLKLLPIFTKEAGPSPEPLVQALGDLGVRVSNMQPCFAEMQDELIRKHRYHVTLDNLTVKAVSSGTLPALDELDGGGEVRQAMFSRVLEHLEQYLRLVTETERPVVSDPENYLSILLSLGDQHDLDHQLTPEQLLDLIGRADPAARISNLAEVRQIFWPGLVELGRVDVTVTNMYTYLEVIHNLVGWVEELNEATELHTFDEDSEAAKRAVAIGVFQVSDVPSEHRVHLVRELELEGNFTPKEITGAAVSLIPQLLNAGRIDESAAWFIKTRDMPETTARYIRATKQLHTYLPELIDLDSREHIVLAEQGSDDAVAVLLENPTLLDDVDSDAAAALARRVEKGVSIPFDTLKILVERSKGGQAVIDLFASCADQLIKTQVQALVAALPEPFSQLGADSVEVPATTQPLVSALRKHGIVGGQGALRQKNVIRVHPPKV